MSELYHSRPQSVRRRPRRRSSAGRFLEPLENRQLLSLTVDLRLPGGGKSATVTNVGQKINLEVWATVKGANSSTSDDGMQMAIGSLLSSNVNGGAANGTMSTFLVSPFNALGSQTGTQRDLDGDGDLDVGSNDNSMVNGFYATRAASLQAGTSFKIGAAVFTVTSLKSTSGQTNLNYRFMVSNAFHHTWQEDGVRQNPQNGDPYYNGSPVVLKLSGGTTPTPTPTPTGSAAISGFVFSDNDKDGVVDSSDPKLSGKRVYIDSNLNGKFDSGEKNVTSNSNGIYTFKDLAAGTYRVRADLPSGTAYSVPSIGYHTVTVSNGQWASGKHFGVKPSTTTTGTAAISGFVFSDNDKDGVVDSSDPKLSGKRVYIDSNLNGKFDSGEKNVTSSSNGIYTFKGLAAGTYRVRADLPSGTAYSVPSIGYHTVTVSNGQWASGKHFGVKPATTTTPTGTGAISGFVFGDSDRDGVLDSSEPKLSNRKIYIDSNLNGKLDSGEKYVTSNSNGIYTLTGLGAGTYRVRRADLPSGYKFSTPSSQYHTVTLSSGQWASGRHFGSVPI